jgi:hypothetical protein|tara:strand:+ start:305 stop:478 length:174 start_codon:yes stop_codon:yes gene_type:complete
MIIVTTKLKKTKNAPISLAFFASSLYSAVYKSTTLSIALLIISENRGMKRDSDSMIL